MALITLKTPWMGVDQDGNVWRFWSYVHTPAVIGFGQAICAGSAVAYWRRASLTCPTGGTDGSHQ